MSIDIFGYFDDPRAVKPVYDPPHDAPCAICLKPLEPPVKTISVMAVGGSRSYFYRIHKGCSDEEAQNRVEGALIDSLSRPKEQEQPE